MSHFQHHLTHFHHQNVQGVPHPAPPYTLCPHICIPFIFPSPLSIFSLLILSPSYLSILSLHLLSPSSLSIFHLHHSSIYSIPPSTPFPQRLPLSFSFSSIHPFIHSSIHPSIHSSIPILPLQPFPVSPFSGHRAHFCPLFGPSVPVLRTPGTLSPTFRFQCPHFPDTGHTSSPVHPDFPAQVLEVSRFHGHLERFTPIFA